MMKKFFLPALLVACLHAAGQISVIYSESATVPDSVLVDFVRQIDDSWNARDLDWFSNLFTDDCDLHFITSGTWIRGKEEVRKHYGKSFQIWTPDIKHLTTPKEIIWLSKDLVMGTGYTEIVSDPGDGSVPKLLLLHNGMMLFRVTPEGMKVQILRAWTEKPGSEP